VLCRSRAQAEEALRRIGEVLGQLGLRLHPEKTRVVELVLRGEGFDFLGCHLRIVRSHFKGRRYLFRWPSTRSMNRIHPEVMAPVAPEKKSGGPAHLVRAAAGAEA
jgi:RNA-directed DNA polymerase